MVTFSLSMCLSLSVSLSVCIHPSSSSPTRVHVHIHTQSEDLGNDMLNACSLGRTTISIAHRSANAIITNGVVRVDVWVCGCGCMRACVCVNSIDKHRRKNLSYILIICVTCACAI